MRRIYRTGCTKFAASRLRVLGEISPYRGWRGDLPIAPGSTGLAWQAGRVIYRMRSYQTVRENLALFHDFFRTYLLPVQIRHGARLIGRWETEDGRVIAVWQYDDRGAYERIDAAVRADPDSIRARQYRAGLPPLITDQQETFMVSTTGEP
jgi:hypothetical protein